LGGAALVTMVNGSVVLLVNRITDKLTRKGCGRRQGGMEGGKGCRDIRDNNQTEVGLREELSNSINVKLMLLQLISMRQNREVAVGYGKYCGSGKGKLFVIAFYMK